MANSEKLTLATKLAKIGKEIGKVDKSGRNTQQSYNYIEYGVVAGRIRELFDTYGVIIVPSVDNYQVDEITGRNGGRGYHYMLNMSFRLINGDDPSDSVTATWLGESADFGDKGINKAETSGTKYFLMRLFNVSEKGEEEADSKSPEFEEITRVVKRKNGVATEFQFTEEEIKAAKEKLEAATNLSELKSTFITLGKVRNCPEIVELKNELKNKFVSEDTDVQIAEGKDIIDAHFNK